MWGEAWGSRAPELLPPWSWGAPCSPCGWAHHPEAPGSPSVGFYGGFSHRRPRISDPASSPSFSRLPSGLKSARCWPGPAPPGTSPRSPRTHTELALGVWGAGSPVCTQPLHHAGTGLAAAGQRQHRLQGPTGHSGGAAGSQGRAHPRPAGRSTSARAACPEPLYLGTNSVSSDVNSFPLCGKGKTFLTSIFASFGNTLSFKIYFSVIL